MKALFLWRIHGKGGQEKEGRGVPTAANHLCRQFGFSWRGNKGQIITKEEAVERRKRGEDVVVCGVDLNANKYLAKGIEAEAIGDMAMVKICPPHPNAGPKALPHCQPLDRPPEGHTFYETEKRKASDA